MSEQKPRKSQRRRAREYAVQALYQWHVSSLSLTELLEQFVTENDFDQVDQSYWDNIVSKSVAAVEILDEKIAPCLSRPLNAVNPVELAILRVAFCELCFFVEVPYRVVINEAVELAKCFGAVDSHRFVNAAVDRAARELRSKE